MGDDECCLDAYAYTLLIDSVEDAEALLNEICSTGLAPTTMAYNAWVDGFYKCGKIEAAFEIMKLIELKGCVMVIAYSVSKVSRMLDYLREY